MNYRPAATAVPTRTSTNTAEADRPTRNANVRPEIVMLIPKFQNPAGRGANPFALAGQHPRPIPRDRARPTLSTATSRTPPGVASEDIRRTHVTLVSQRAASCINYVRRSLVSRDVSPRSHRCLTPVRPIRCRWHRHFPRFSLISRHVPAAP